MIRNRFQRFVTWSLITAVVAAPTGCSRRFWREQAETDSYRAVTEKLDDQRWTVPRFSITPDKRSRFYDPYDADCKPLPPDDPAAHKYMHCANGMKGYKSWHKFGDMFSMENPHWLEPFGVSLDSAGNIDPVTAHSSVELKEISLEEAIELSYIHSREYQTTIEDLYLAALDLTFQRFQFGVRYLGTTGTEPSIGASAAAVGGGPEQASLNASLGLSQALPAGGQWAVELANNTLWLFGAGGGAATSSSTLAFQLVQPLLFRAGRQVAMENLTQSERNVLYSARTLARFRKQFFADTANAYLFLLQQRQSITNRLGNIERLKEQIEIQLFRDARRPLETSADLAELPENFEVPESLKGRLRHDGNFLFLRAQELTDEERSDLLNASDDPDYRRAAGLIAELLGADTTSLNALQLLTDLTTNQNDLRNDQRALQDQLDAFKTQLGLPPDIKLEIDTAQLKPFELIVPELTELENEVQDSLEIIKRPLTAPTDFETTVQLVKELTRIAEKLDTSSFKMIDKDIEPVEALVKTDGNTDRVITTEEESERLKTDLKRDKRLYSVARSEFSIAQTDLETLNSILEGDTAEEGFKRLDKNSNGSLERKELPFFDSIIFKKADKNEDETISQQELLGQIESIALDIREDLLRTTLSLQVLQAGLRTELVAVNHLTIRGNKNPDIDEVVKLGLENRLDLMNARAAVMDARRRLEVAANALESTLDLRVDGSIGTDPGGKNPFDFRQDESRIDVGLQLTTPLDQISERNDYSAALIAYQRARRAYMQTEDNVKSQIRRSWRQLQVSEQQLEIDRQNIRQAALQYDLASQQAARGTQGGNAFSLLQALNSLLRAQNRLVSDWIRYEVNRLNIYRDMGIMEIDERGLWNDAFYQVGQNSPAASGFNLEDDALPVLSDPEKVPADEPVTPDQPRRVPPADDDEIPPAPPRGVNGNDNARRDLDRLHRRSRYPVVAKQPAGDVFLEGLQPIPSIHHGKGQ